MRPARAPLSAFRRHGRGGVHPGVSRSSQAVGADRRCTGISLICTWVLGGGGGVGRGQRNRSLSFHLEFVFFPPPEGTSRFRGFTEAGKRRTSTGRNPESPATREREREREKKEGWGEGAEEGRPRVTPKCTRFAPGFFFFSFFFFSEKHGLAAWRTINAFTVATVTKRSIQPASYRTRLEVNMFRFITQISSSPDIPLITCTTSAPTHAD